jgi:hypothetical protein
MFTATTFQRDSLLTGLFYLGLAVTGAMSFLMVRPELFAVGEPTTTLANLVERESLARLGLALELGIILFQALAALWFARLFHEVDAFAAGAVTLFGMVNAIAILAGAALLHAALAVASGSTGADPWMGHFAYVLSGSFWQIGSLFFGLWLMPMGWLVLKSGFGHHALGWILILGGVGYVLGVFVAVLLPKAGAWAASLSIPATVGEFWIIILLVWRGLRPSQPGRPFLSAQA